MKGRTKLKPCPFCGGEAYLEEVRIQSDDTMWFVIHCNACAAMMDFMNDDILKNKDMAGNSVFDIEDFHKAVEEAIASWNERTKEGGANENHR